MSLPLPPNESVRLQTLKDYEILDTAPEAAFDDLALLAAHICQVPTAMVSLVDESRQWFKARVNMDASETPRGMAFCAHTILQPDDILEVKDTRDDPRFAENPLVKSELQVRFYAGAPLVAPNGQALGALCVMDRTPRTLSPEQRSALQALARRVVGQLELLRQTRKLRTGEAETGRLLAVADKSRKALLSLLEDQKLAETALRQSEQLFRQIAENIHEVFWMTDAKKHEMLYISPAYESIWGRTCASLYAAPGTWSDSVHPDDRNRVRTAAATRQVKGDYNEVYRVHRPDGTVRWVKDRAFPVKDETGDVVRIVGVVEDITDRRMAEMRVELQHTITRVLAEGAPLPQTARNILDIICRTMEWEIGGFWTLDRTAKILRAVAVSQPLSATLRPFVEATRVATFAPGRGLPGAVWAAGQSIWIPEVTSDENFERGGAATLAGLRGALGIPIKLRREVVGVMDFFSTASRPPVPEMLTMFGVLGAQIGQFIERQQLADQFRQAQKMEAIGTLAGGIAHDFNNVLGGISGYTELARMEVKNQPVVSEYLDAIMQGSKRAADLVRQILAFSRRQELERRSLQLSVVVTEALKLLRATVPVTIQFEVSIATSLPNVLADPSQVHQVVMNLCTNAAHAMRDRPGKLSISLDNHIVHAEVGAVPAGMAPGAYVRLSVRDTGHGMDEATQSRIFEPFFTTKAPGEGTGLGLSVVHGIMQSHDGTVTVHSHAGEGTVFHLDFPAMTVEPAETVAGSPELPRGAGERILFVDDEVLLAAMGRDFLERIGYKVDARTNPLDALAAYRAAPNAYDLLVTDQLMPSMMGTTLAEHIHEIRPDLPIILTTGFTATLTAERIQALGIQRLLLKPLLLETLAAAVGAVLRKPSEPSAERTIRG